MDTTELLDGARAAFDARAWQDAYDGFLAADQRTPLQPEDLERFATAGYLTGHDIESADAWTQAHHAWGERGNEPRAAHCAFWLGFGLVQRGEMARGGGWLTRARRMVEEHELDTVERGYLLVPEGLMALGAGEPDTAFERFTRADALGRRFADSDLVALGTLGKGQALLSMGLRAEGLRLFDEAMVAVTSNETSPTISGLVYCAVIVSCQEVFDLRRAREWTAALDRWCAEQPGLVPYRGQCLVHRSQLLQARGDWTAAIDEVEQAREWLTDPPHPAVGMAHYQLGELHRLCGELPEAEESYRRAHAAGREPQPGLALLRLAEGRADAAAAAIGSALDAAPDQLARAQLLPAFCEVMIAVDRREDVRTALDELDDLVEGGDATVLSAVADQIRGALTLAEGDPVGALGVLRTALDAWQEVDAPYEAAKVRLLIARACWQLDDPERAELECDAARDVFQRLGASPAIAQLDRLLGSSGPDASDAHVQDRLVTDREWQVLRLVAAGRTNREIADELAISEKTVERHLGNIFVKSDASNRAAATAWAYDRGLL